MAFGHEAKSTMALNIITASQGGTCVIIQRVVDTYIPDESAEVSSLLNHIKTEVNVLTDLTLSPGDLINQWFRSRVEKIITYFGNYYLDLCFLLYVPLLLLWHLPPVQPDRHQMSCLQATETPCW